MNRCPTFWRLSPGLAAPVTLALALGFASPAAAQSAPAAAPPAAVAQPNAAALDPVGDWFTIHDETHKATSVVHLGWEKDELVGRVVRVIASARGPNPTCDKCSGERQGKPIVGMDILGGLRGKDGTYEGGYVIDPAKGKQYRAKIKMRSANTLELRGYLGISAFGRTQVWQRVAPGADTQQGA